MAKAWMSEDRNKAMKALQKAVDKKRDPARLDRIAAEAALPDIRERASACKAELEGYVARAEQNDPKCPKCGAPLVPAVYYTAVKGATVVTGVKTEWQGASQKRTVSTSTPYSQFRRHTDTFCPRCASRKARRKKLPPFLLFLGLLAALAFGIMLIVGLATDNHDDRYGTIALIGTGAGIAVAFIGYQLMMRTQFATAAWASKRKLPLTSEELSARLRGTAFGGRPFDDTGRFDMSDLYVCTRYLSDIPHEDDANVALTQDGYNTLMKYHS